MCNPCSNVSLLMSCSYSLNAMLLFAVLYLLNCFTLLFVGSSIGPDMACNMLLFDTHLFCHVKFFKRNTSFFQDGCNVSAVFLEIRHSIT